MDLLYHGGRCLMREPLGTRREVLAEVCAKLDIAAVAFSPAVLRTGIALYEAALAGGHEGVMAKQLQSVYRPGKGSSAWKKIKPGARFVYYTSEHS
jgi:DNA ligase-1